MRPGTMQGDKVRKFFAMSKVKDVRWGKWVGMITGVLVVLSSHSCS